MNELAVKAANGTNSSSDRDAIQDEISQLTTEIDRVSETTKFNETYLLKGDEDAAKDIDFQYKPLETLSQDLYYLEGTSVKTVEKGTVFSKLTSDKTYYTDSTGDTAGVLIDSTQSNQYGANSAVVSTTGYYTKSGSSYYEVPVGAIYAAGTSYYEGSAAGLTGAVDSDMTVAAASAVSADSFILSKEIYDSDGKAISSGTNIGDASVLASYYVETGDVLLGNNNSVAFANLSNYKDSSTVQFVDKEGNKIAANGLSKYIDSNGKLISGSGLYVKSGSGQTDHDKANQDDVDAMVDSSGKYDMGALTLKLHVGADATANNQISIDIKAMSAKSLGVEGLKVDGNDDTNALSAIETIKAALEKVSDQRSALGAVQNRLEHTINNLDNVVENTTSAESQIRDTDMATEMVRYSNAQVLSQAGQAMLAQANQSNQGVLSLLG
jgi:flagellin